MDRKAVWRLRYNAEVYVKLFWCTAGRGHKKPNLFELSLWHRERSRLDRARPGWKISAILKPDCAIQRLFIHVDEVYFAESVCGFRRGEHE